MPRVQIQRQSSGYTYTAEASVPHHLAKLKEISNHAKELNRQTIDVIVIEPQRGLITLDLDLHDKILEFGDPRNIDDVLYTKSRNGRTHAYLALKEDMYCPEAKALAACCFGSDPKREYLSYNLFYKKQQKTAYCMFETEEESPKVMRWLAKRKFNFWIYGE